MRKTSFVLGLVICLGALAANHGLAQQQSQQAQASKAPTSQYEATQAPFSVVIVETPQDTAHNASREQQADKHDAADLLAQQQAASAAIASADASQGQLQPLWLSVWLSALAAIASVAAIIISIWAFRSSDKATRSELRAYVNASEVDVQELDGYDGPVAHVFVKNTGSTPAQVTAFCINVSGGQFDPGWDRPEVVCEPHHFTLGSGEKKTLFQEMTTEDLAHPNVYLFGKVEYSDIFGKKWETNFTRMLMPPKKAGGKWDSRHTDKGPNYGT